MPGTKMPAPYVPDSEVLSMEGAENDWGKALVALDGDTLDMLNGIRDYLWNIKGDANIDELIRSYFLENGYDFDNIGSPNKSNCILSASMRRSSSVSFLQCCQ